MELKKGLFFGSLAVAMMAVTSCSQDDAIAPSASNEAAFSTSIRPVQTRIDAWSGSEQVGVYMVSGSEMAASNVAYDVAASGDLTAAVAGISYPATGNVAFKAYYPYASGNGATVAIDLTDGNTADHDLIFAETTADYSAATTDKVQLTFRHQLAKLSLKMADNSAATFKVNGLSSASFDVATGVVTNGTATAEMTPNSNGDVIVLPGKSVTSVKVTTGGKDYTWDASAITFTKNMQSKYALTIDGDAVTATLIASIEDWTQDDGTGTVDPQPQGQKIADVRALSPADGESVVIAQEMTVTGSVIAQNDPSGSFYRAIIISDGETALYIYDEETAKLSFAIGDEVSVDLNGATLKNYNGLIEAMSTGTDFVMSTKITKTGNTKVIAPKVVSAADLANYQSMLVTIKDASAPAEATVWGNKDNGTTIAMSSTTGAFNVYTSKHSNFIDETVPTGTGDVTGIVGWYKAPQIIFASAEGWAGLNGSSTGGDTGNTGGDTGNTGGDTGNTGGDTGSTADVVTFPVTFDFTTDATNGSGVFEAAGANSMATMNTYGANPFEWKEGYGTALNYVTANGFNANSGWEFTLPVKNLAAGAVIKLAGEMRSSNTGPGRFVLQYSVDGGSTFVSSSTTIDLAGKDYFPVEASIAVTEGLASGTLIIRTAVAENLSAKAVKEGTDDAISATGTHRFSNGSVVISLGADS